MATRPSRAGRGGAIAYAVAAAVLLATVWAGSARLVNHTFPGFLLWDNGVLMSMHRESWTGLRAGLPLNGGVLVAVAGEPFENGRALLDRTRRLAPGIPVVYAVQYQGHTREFTVPSMRLSMGDYAATFGIYGLIAVSFLAVGALALAWGRTPGADRIQARSLAVICAAIGSLAALAIDYVTAYRLGLLCQGVEALAPVVLAHFALVFPVERLPARRRRIALAILASLAFAAWSVRLWVFYDDPATARSITVGLYLAVVIVVLGMIVSFAEALFRARDPMRRIQAAVVFAGSLPTAGLPVLGIMAFTLLGSSLSWSWAVACAAAFPPVFLYALLRRDLLEAERAVRITVGYSVVLAAVMLGYAGGVALAERWLAPTHPVRSVAAVAFLVAVVVWADPLRRRVEVAIDRAFFRSRSDFSRVLEEFSIELAKRSERAQIADFLENRLAAALDLSWVELQLDPGAGPKRQPALDEPVRFGSETLGRVACGAKRSGAPFSAAERELVQSLASQAALAVHNVDAIEALRKAQAALVQSARLAAVGEFAGAVAHGVRNPLASIRAGAQVAQRQSTGGPLAETLADIVAEADHLDQRIRALLDLSRPYAPRLVQIDLRRVLDAVATSLQPQARRAGAELVLDLPGEPVNRAVDADFLEEALLELGANGLRAMAGGGQLHLSLTGRDGGAQIVLADSGPGIPEGVRDRIFEPFFTTRRDGTGIGLASVRKIVEAHGGRVSLDSTGPRGTAFRIQI